MVALLCSPSHPAMVPQRPQVQRVCGMHSWSLRGSGGRRMARTDHGRLADSLQVVGQGGTLVGRDGMYVMLFHERSQI
jgi:hypothetical protein